MQKTLLGLLGIALAAAITATSVSGASLRRELTPQERALYVKQQHGAHWRSLSLQQRCSRMQQMRREWRHMSPAALQKLKQQLDAAWKTLPAAEKHRIEQRIARHQARKAEGHHKTRGQHERRCAGVNEENL